MHAAAPSASVRPAAVVTDEARRNSGRRRQMVERVQPDARDRFDSSASPGEECVERVIEDKKRCEGAGGVARSPRCNPDNSRQHRQAAQPVPPAEVQGR